MSPPPIPSEEREQLAAEYALGVLDGDDLAMANSLLAGDRAFAAEVARWSGRLAPLLDEVDPVAAPEHVWDAIERRVASTGGQRDNVYVLRRKVNAWRGAAAGAAALAASLALVMFVRPPTAAPPVTPPSQAPAPAPMVAVLGGEQPGPKLVASWDPADRSLVVAAAGEIASDGVHVHELWVIPADGTPRSLGVMPPSARMHAQLPEPMARQLQQGATLAISVEPQGGSPTGLPTGAVIASGKLDPA